MYRRHWHAVIFTCLVLLTGTLFAPSGAADEVKVKAIAAGCQFSLILKADGTVWAWGENDYGQLGNGAGGSSKIPEQVLGPTDITAIAAGRYYGLAISSNGRCWTWGMYSGDLDGPRKADYDRGNITAISAGPYHRLFVSEMKSLGAEGLDGAGQVGSNRSTAYEPFFSSRKPSLSSIMWCKMEEAVTAVAAGAYHSLALMGRGTVLSWGENRRGQLGSGQDGSRLTPGEVTGLSNVKAIAAGGMHSLALRGDGTVWSWGDNSCGQLGDGSFTERRAPVQVMGLSGITAIAAGYTFSLALKQDGTVWGWGDNTCRQLDRAEPLMANKPVRLDGLSNIVAIAAGTSHGLALGNDCDSIWYWGYVGYDLE